MSISSLAVHRSSLIGVVLCGGKSTRMGSDKGLLVKDGKIWAQYIADLFIALKIPFAISCRIEQRENYEKFFSPEVIVTDKFLESENTIQGPLNGILSTHSAFTEKDLLIVACDMVQMSVPVLEKLISEYQTDSGFQISDFGGVNAKELSQSESEIRNPKPEIFCFRLQKNDFVEPLCAIYSETLLQKILSDFYSGKETPRSLQNLIKTNCSFIIPTSDNFAFSNFNYPI